MTFDNDYDESSHELQKFSHFIDSSHESWNNPEDSFIHLIHQPFWRTIHLSANLTFYWVIVTMEDDDEYDGDLLKFPDEVNNGVIEERAVPLSDSKSKSTCTT